jgi:hypothetical protein
MPRPSRRPVVLRPHRHRLNGWRLRRVKPGCQVRRLKAYEIAAASSELIEAAALASRSPGELVSADHNGRLSLCERVPVGLVGAITPWNFPLVLEMRVIAPAVTRTSRGSPNAAGSPSIPAPCTIRTDAHHGDAYPDRAESFLVSCLRVLARCDARLAKTAAISVATAAYTRLLRRLVSGFSTLKRLN